MRLTVIANSNITGKAVVENLTNGQNAEQELSSTTSLCGENVEWIVEDPAFNNNTLMPINDFDAVTFKDAFALRSDSKILTPDGATVILMEQNNQTITSVKVTISYNGTHDAPLCGTLVELLDKDIKRAPGRAITY